MTEARILQLLHSLNSKKEEFPPHGSLIPEYIKSVSKSLANIVYSTVKVKSLSATSKRVDCIQLIQKWCGQDPHHYNVDEDNVHIFLKSTIAPKNDSEIEFVEDFFKSIQSEFDDKAKDDFFKEFIDYYDEKDKKDAEENQLVEQLAQLDRESIEDTHFIFTKPIVKKTYEPMESFLTNFFKSNPLEPKVSEKTVVFKDTANLRKNDVSAAYALLNVAKKKSNKNIDFAMVNLKTILKRIRRNPILEKDEVDLVIYLFLNSDFTQDLPTYLLENFPIIYEKPFIILCTKFLQSDYTDLHEELQSEPYKRILSETKKNKKILRQIKSMLYELFCLAKYDERILRLVEEVGK